MCVTLVFGCPRYVVVVTDSYEGILDGDRVIDGSNVGVRLMRGPRVWAGFTGQNSGATDAARRAVKCTDSGELPVLSDALHDSFMEGIEITAAIWREWKPHHRVRAFTNMVGFDDRGLWTATATPLGYLMHEYHSHWAHAMGAHSLSLPPDLSTSSPLYQRVERHVLQLTHAPPVSIGELLRSLASALVALRRESDRMDDTFNAAGFFYDAHGAVQSFGRISMAAEQAARDAAALQEGIRATTGPAVQPVEAAA